MYLSRLILDPRSRAVQRDLADVQDLHRTVMSVFPSVPPSSEARARLGVLYRLESIRNQTGAGLPALIVQSRETPDWTRLPPRYLLEASGVQNPAYKAVDGVFERLQTGMALRFRLRANPAKKVRPESGAGNSKRVELRGEDDQIDWLQRKSAQAGFRLLRVQPDSLVPDTRVVPEDKLRGRRPNHHNGQADALTVGAVLFEGALEITDVSLFRQALAGGIGPGRAYGCGLLSIAPLRS